MARPARTRAAPPATQTASPPTRILYSAARSGDLSNILGLAHYSYRFAEQKFLAAFAAFGHRAHLLQMPEYYATRTALPGDLGHDPQARLLHLIFRSTEQIRLLHPGINIVCYAWEFEVMKDWTGPNEHPFENQVRMLSLCDEVWVPCRYTQDVLRRHGVEAVHVIPAPIPIPGPRLALADSLALIGQLGVMPLRYNFLLTGSENGRGLLQRLRSLIDWLAPYLADGGRPMVYLAILNPEDYRKNLDALLRGFHHFSQTEPRALLLVKMLTSTNRWTLDGILAEIVPNKLDEGSVFDTDRIMFFASYLSDEQMRGLYCLADFYLCTSMAEGQNLPLLEAMAEGTVPVSTGNTAMADYLTPDNAFVIASAQVPAVTGHLAGSIAQRPFRVAHSGPRDVWRALRASAEATPRQRAGMGMAARAAVRRQYSPEAVWPLIQARLDALAPGPK